MNKNKEYRACLRKRAYSKKEAQELAVLRSIKTGRGGYAYNCDYCGWWHLTKKERVNGGL